MDAEHGECAAALQQLAMQQSMPALQAVHFTLSAHFTHEEALMEKHGFGIHADERFSARKTHIEDHHRILRKIQQELRPAANARVAATFIKELLTDFHEHTSRYDVQYADLLCSKGAQ